MHLWGIPKVHRAEDLLRGDLYLIPGIPQLDHLPEDFSNTHHIGPLINGNAASDRLPANFPLRENGPVLYLTLGGGTVKHQAMRILQAHYAVFGNSSWQVVVSAGNQYDPCEAGEIPQNFKFFRWLPGRSAIDNSDVVVFHGGHTTMMETAASGIPSIVLPFQSEQEGNGRRLALQQAGFVISPSTEKNAAQLFRSRWLWGEFSMWAIPEYHYCPELLRDTANTLLRDPKYRDGAKKLSKTVSKYTGAAAAIEKISETLR